MLRIKNRHVSMCYTFFQTMFPESPDFVQDMWRQLLSLPPWDPSHGGEGLPRARTSPLLLAGLVEEFYFNLIGTSYCYWKIIIISIKSGNSSKQYVYIYTYS